MGLEDDLKARRSPSSASRWPTGSWRSSGTSGAPGQPRARARRAAGDGRPLRREDRRAAIAAAHGRGRRAASPRRPRPATRRLKASLAAIEKGASLSEVLTYLVNEVSQYVDRAAMFIVKGRARSAGTRRGFEPRTRSSRSACRSTRTRSSEWRTTRGTRSAATSSHSPGTAQALWPASAATPRASSPCPSSCATRWRPILYCDTAQEEVAAGDADLIEILVSFAGKIIDLL